ncbi:MAG: response regulator [Spirochaetota bacterium]
MENILIVDDEENILNILSELVRRWGYNPIKALSGEEALKKFNDLSIDLVITDLMMPGMDGITLIKKIIEMRENTMIIMLTGYPSIESAVEAIRNGAYDYLAKPVNTDELQIKIKRSMERKDLLRSKLILRGINWALIISIPFWLILGIILANILR